MRFIPWGGGTVFRFCSMVFQGFFYFSKVFYVFHATLLYFDGLYTVVTVYNFFLIVVYFFLGVAGTFVFFCGGMFGLILRAFCMEKMFDSFYESSSEFLLKG